MTIFLDPTNRDERARRGERVNDEERKLMTRADTYLLLCEQRKLDEASKYLAPDAELVFPGDVHFCSLPEMVADAATRYQWVRKHRTTYVVGRRAGDGLPVVISTGTLDGEGLDGTTFAGVRYSDMFVFNGDLIAEQYVFNDLSETGASPRLVERASDQSVRS